MGSGLSKTSIWAFSKKSCTSFHFFFCSYLAEMPDDDLKPDWWQISSNYPPKCQHNHLNKLPSAWKSKTSPQHFAPITVCNCVFGLKAFSFLSPSKTHIHPDSSTLVSLDQRKAFQNSSQCLKWSWANFNLALMCCFLQSSANVWQLLLTSLEILLSKLFNRNRSGFF